MRFVAACIALVLATACEGTTRFREDASVDTSAEDVTTDVVHDTASDTLADTTVDTATDVWPDTTVDPVPDTSADTHVDTAVDPVPDTSADTAPDVDPDGPCTPVASLSCDSTISGTNDGPGSTDLLEDYDCVAFPESGPEIAYSFTAASDTNLALDLTGLTDDLDLFVLGSSGGVCDPATCLADSSEPTTDPEHLVYRLDGGSTVYVMVEGFSDAVSSFNLQVGCSAPEICDNGADDDGDGASDCEDFHCMATSHCPETCTPRATLSCGSSVSGSTATGETPDEIDRWSCSDLLTNGPEMVYSFTTYTSGNVNFSLSGHDPALDVFVVSASSTGVASCVSTDCIAHDMVSVDFWAEAGRTYYLIVDGTDGYAGAFTVSVSCG